MQKWKYSYLSLLLRLRIRLCGRTKFVLKFLKHMFHSRNIHCYFLHLCIQLLHVIRTDIFRWSCFHLLRHKLNFSLHMMNKVRGPHYFRLACLHLYFPSLLFLAESLHFLLKLLNLFIHHSDLLIRGNFNSKWAS